MTRVGALVRAPAVHLSTQKTHHLLFDGCIIHDGYNNDLIKINDVPIPSSAIHW